MAAAITQPVYEQMLDSAARVHECENLSVFPRVALEEISKLVDCDHSTFNYLAPTIPKATLLALPVVPGADVAREEMFAQHWTDQPMLRHYLATGDGAAYKISDFLSVRQYHALPLYQHLYRGLNCEDQMEFMLFSPGSELIFMALARGRRSFTECDRPF